MTYDARFLRESTGILPAQISGYDELTESFNVASVDPSGRLCVTQFRWDEDTWTWVPDEGSSGAGTEPSEIYALNNVDTADTTYIYLGESSSGSAWKISRFNKSTLEMLYATGASAYSTAWTNRASQSYGQ